MGHRHPETEATFVDFFHSSLMAPLSRFDSCCQRRSIPIYVDLITQNVFDCVISTEATFAVQPQTGEGTYVYRKEYAYED